MRQDHFPALSSLNTQPVGLYQVLPLARLRAFDQGRSDRVMDMLNRAWDFSPRLSIARFDLAFPHGGAGGSGTLRRMMRRYFRTLSTMIQRSGAEYGERAIDACPTRLWGLWSADTPVRGANSRIRVACLLDRDVCMTWQSPGNPWQSVLANTILVASGVVHRHRPELSTLSVQLPSDWLQSADGYGDVTGFKSVFRQLSKLCEYPACLFGCGLVPNRVADLELFPADAFLFPPMRNQTLPLSPSDSPSKGSSWLAVDPEKGSSPGDPRIH